MNKQLMTQQEVTDYNMEWGERITLTDPDDTEVFFAFIRSIAEMNPTERTNHIGEILSCRYNFVNGLPDPDWDKRAIGQAMITRLNQSILAHIAFLGLKTGREMSVGLIQAFADNAPMHYVVDEVVDPVDEWATKNKDASNIDIGMKFIELTSDKLLEVEDESSN